MRHYPPRHPANPAGHRSHWRNRAEQARFRTSLLHAAGPICQRCGATGQPLHAHHDTPTSGRLLCIPCHKAVDPHAR